MTTVLFCERCGRQAGEASRMAELHPIYAGSPWADVVIVKGRQQDSNRRWFGTAGTALATTAANPARPGDWPVRWDCPHCGIRVALPRDDAREVGMCPRLTVHPVN